MTRIIHLIPHDGIGGVEESARYLARSLPAHDYRLLLLAGPAREHLETIQASRSANALSPIAWWHAVRHIRSARPELLMFSLWKSVPAAFLATLLARPAKLVFTLNSCRTIHWPDRIASAVALWLADEVWADSSETLNERAPNHPGGRVIDHFLPMSPATTIDAPARPNFIVWARLDPDKGLDRAIDLIAQLVTNGVDATYSIIGPDSGSGPALRGHVARAGLESRVTFQDAVSRADLPEVAQGATFFLMPSRLEGMAVATVEAMQLGLIPVVTAVGEMKNYVRDGFNGLIIDPDDLGEASNRIKLLLANPSKIAEMRSAARAEWSNNRDFASNILAATDRLLGNGAGSTKPSSDYHG